MNRSNLVVSRIAIFLAFALALMSGSVSCVKSVVEDADTVTLSGRWARTDNSYMTASYVEFRPDEMIEYESAEAKIIQDGTIWNSSESDFVEKSSAKYTVSGGMLIVAGEEVGKVSVNDDELTVGDERLIRISGFSDDAFCGIDIQEEVACDYHSGEISVGYRILNPLPDASLAVSCNEDWVEDLTVAGENITFRVSENNSGSARTATITAEYPGADAKALTVRQQSDAVPLDDSGTANCYIVSIPGSYTFHAVKGNSSEPLESVSSVEVLWESFGTDVAPRKGDLIASVVYNDGIIRFSTGEEFKEGNAVIAAEDASGTILWSWHIWLTDKPEDQVYNNGAGTMMDRNLGATSAAPGDAGSLGLLYQWGRKDPFLGSSSISEEIEAASSITWPEPVVSASSTGTIAYAVAHPTTFIEYDSSNYDWYYTGSGDTDNTRWQSRKTVYDPCPPGYRVPDGGDNGVWSKAFGTSSLFDDNTYDTVNGGFDFGASGEGSRRLADADVCWYPAAGYKDDYYGTLYNTGYDGNYWSCSPKGKYAYTMYFYYYDYAFPAYSGQRAFGYSVRCVKE